MSRQLYSVCYHKLLVAKNLFFYSCLEDVDDWDFDLIRGVALPPSGGHVSSRTSLASSLLKYVDGRIK